MTKPRSKRGNGRVNDLTDVLRVLRASSRVLASRYGVRRIGVSGSFATGKAGTASDVDLLVEFSRPIGLEFVALAEYLEERLGRGVDLLTPAGLESIRVPGIADSIRRAAVYV